MIYLNKKLQKGFSLVETLVAISILLIVIVGPMTISSKAAKSSTFATEQVQAFFLAQEGLELAQKMRDDFLLVNFSNSGSLSTGWVNFIDSPAFSTCSAPGPGCGLAWNNLPVTSLVTPVLCINTTCRLYLSPTPAHRSRYTHVTAGNTITPFTRVITFTADNAGGVKVVSKVTWRTGSLIADQKVEVDTYLYDIYGSL